MHFFNFLLPAIEHFRILGYALIFVVSLVESLAFVGLAVPGTLILLMVGILVSQGFLDLFDSAVFVTLGAILGDIVSFILGRKFSSPNKIMFASAYMAKGQEFFKKHGGKSILLGRFIGPLRPIIPFVAGLSNMEVRRFLAWSIFSSSFWTMVLLIFGYFFGQTLRAIGLWTARIGIVAVVLALFMLLAYFMKKLYQSNGKIG
ncbi:MAG: DedA family protein [Candidatus Niyogibacteria bacterium]|nr:DedA family protein [Candidatus Niyogibacteria bacterium]